MDIKASVFYRRYNPSLRFLEPLKLSCIKRQMKKAAKNGEVFHIWWHPHNLGRYTEKSLDQLKEIFSYYQKLNADYGFESKNMGEMVEELRNENCTAV